jgi:hypothetical protein
MVAGLQQLGMWLKKQVFQVLKQPRLLKMLGRRQILGQQ